MKIQEESKFLKEFALEEYEKKPEEITKLKLKVRETIFRFNQIVEAFFISKYVLIKHARMVGYVSIKDLLDQSDKKGTL